MALKAPGPALHAHVCFPQAGITSVKQRSIENNFCRLEGWVAFPLFAQKLVGSGARTGSGRQTSTRSLVITTPVVLMLRASVVDSWSVESKPPEPPTDCAAFWHNGIT